MFKECRRIALLLQDTDGGFGGGHARLQAVVKEDARVGKLFLEVVIGRARAPGGRLGQTFLVGGHQKQMRAADEVF